MVYNSKKSTSNPLSYVGIPHTNNYGASIGITAVTNTSNIETLCNYFDDMPLGYYKVEETTVLTGDTVDNAITIKQGEAIVSKNGMFEMTAASYSAKICGIFIRETGNR